jgi:26S proteasome regulatory subunit N4
MFEIVSSGWLCDMFQVISFTAFSSSNTTTMGFTLPSPESPTEQTRTLMNQKSDIEAELESHISILKANNVTMQTPLVDVEGFPRADIDIYAVRGARVRIIELRNDLKAVVDAIGRALEGIYDPAIQRSSQIESNSERPLQPFAKVDGVAPGSPAAEAVRIYKVLLYIHVKIQTNILSGPAKR